MEPSLGSASFRGVYDRIVAKLKKRLFRKTNTVPTALAELAQLRQALHDSNAKQHEAFTLFSMARCEKALQHPNKESALYIEAGRILWNLVLEDFRMNYEAPDDMASEALQLMLLGIQIYEAQGLWFAVSRLYEREIADHFVELGRLEEAVPFYGKSAEIVEQLDAHTGAGIRWKAVCTCMRMGDYDQIVPHCIRIQHSYREHCKRQHEDQRLASPEESVVCGLLIADLALLLAFLTQKLFADAERTLKEMDDHFRAYVHVFRPIDLLKMQMKQRSLETSFSSVGSGDSLQSPKSTVLPPLERFPLMQRMVQRHQSQQTPAQRSAMGLWVSDSPIFAVHDGSNAGTEVSAVCAQRQQGTSVAGGEGWKPLLEWAENVVDACAHNHCSVLQVSLEEFPLLLSDIEERENRQEKPTESLAAVLKDLSRQVYRVYALPAYANRDQLLLSMVPDDFDGNAEE